MGKPILHNYTDSTDFIMERAKDEKKAEAKALLGEGFSRQAAGTFDKGYFQEIVPRILDLIKPEAVNEVKAAMEDFGSRL
ncbi:MAG: hypothetical protein GX177_05485 [Firmicutes bacterium]|jgi:hypothetical protein|nr:hypothetical protein [Bacillota bacterium]